MRSSKNSKKSHIHRPWSSWKTLKTLVFCWKGDTAGFKQSRFLQYINDNFLAQITEKPIKKGTWLDLVLISKEELVRNVKSLTAVIIGGVQDPMKKE